MKQQLLTLGLILGVAGTQVYAADAWKLVVRVKGKVESSVDNQVSWQPIFGQRILKVNDSARTGPDSAARIQMQDGTVAELAPNTVAKMAEFDTGARPKVRIQVESGGARAKVSHVYRRGQFQLDTKNGVLAAQGTDFACWYKEDTPPAEAYLPGPLADLPGPKREFWVVYSAVFEGVISATGRKGEVVTLEAGDIGALGADGHVVANPPGVNTDSMPPSLHSTPGGGDRNVAGGNSGGTAGQAAGTSATTGGSSGNTGSTSNSGTERQVETSTYLDQASDGHGDPPFTQHGGNGGTVLPVTTGAPGGPTNTLSAPTPLGNTPTTPTTPTTPLTPVGPPKGTIEINVQFRGR